MINSVFFIVFILNSLIAIIMKLSITVYPNTVTRENNARF